MPCWHCASGGGPRPSSRVDLSSPMAGAAAAAPALKVMPKSSSFTGASFAPLTASWPVHASKGLSTPGVRANLTKLLPRTFIMGSLPTTTGLASSALACSDAALLAAAASSASSLVALASIFFSFFASVASAFASFFASFASAFASFFASFASAFASFFAAAS